MILKRFYSIPNRIDVTFTNGLNVICADKTESSSQKDTRNGAGKSTLIKLIDFCLLADIEDNILTSEDFKKFEFILELQDEYHYYKIKRQINNPDIIFFATDSDDWRQKDLEESKALFKEIFFGLPFSERNELTFRTLMNFIMRDEKRGFSDVFNQYPLWPKYLANSANLLLIGLDYKLPLEKESLNSQKSIIEKIVYGLTKDLEHKKVQNKSFLKAQKAIIDEQIFKREKVLKNFKVLEEYEELEKEANLITFKIKEIQNQIYVNRQKLEEYKEAISQPISFEFSEIEDLYKSMKIYLNEIVKRRFEEITNFHRKVIENRNTFLQEEIKRIDTLLNNLKVSLSEYDSKRSKVMSLLETHGALAEYNLIMQRLDEDKRTSFMLLNQIKLYDEIQEYKKNKDEILTKIRENNKLSEDMINKHEAIIKNLVLIFKDVFESICNIPEVLIIGIKEGYKVDEQVFDFRIMGERGRSFGVKRSQILAYDLSIILHNINLNRTFPKFIIHDGIFHGIDARQIENFLKYVNNKIKEFSFQYIVSMNTDEFDIIKFDFGLHVICRLTDTDKGSLMGFKF